MLFVRFLRAQYIQYYYSLCLIKNLQSDIYTLKNYYFQCGRTFLV